MHLTDEVIDRLVRRELAGTEERAARAHLESCTECTRRHAVAAREDREIAQALASLDYPILPVSADDVIRRSRARSVRRWRIVTAAAAASIAAVAAAAAMPGSPIRRWLEREAPPAVVAPPAATTAGAPSPSVPEDARGVSITPGDSAEIVFDTWQDAGEVSIRVEREPALRVRARDAEVGFVVASTSVRVRNSGSRASYDVLVPESLGRVRVVVAGREVFVRRGGDVTVGPEARAGGELVISLQADR